jgi:uncharacterized membrane protein YgcG
MTRTIRTMLVGGALCASLVAAPVASAHHDKGDDSAPAKTATVGTVSSYDGTTLVIKANNGAETSAAVTERTRVRCKQTSQTSRRGAKSRSAKGKAKAAHNGGGNHGGRGHGRRWHGPRTVPCPTGALAAGAKVKDAGLWVSDSGPQWANVTLLLG